MENINFKNLYTFECYDKNGNLKWTEEHSNLVVTQGRNHILDVAFDEAVQYGGSGSRWYIGLTGANTVPNAADTLPSHAGWAEITGAANYPTRQEVLWDSLSSSATTIDNSDTPVSFSFSSIPSGNTVGGAFLCTSSAGTSGILYGVADFTGADRAIVQGDVINVVVTIGVTSS